MNIISFIKSFYENPKQASNPVFTGPRFPTSDQANDWMAAKLEHWKKYKPDIAYRLFDPSIADYMPSDVHVGSSWKPEHQAFYRQLKAENPDLVEQARASFRDNGRFCQSRYGDPEDFDPDVKLLP